MVKAMQLTLYALIDWRNGRKMGYFAWGDVQTYGFISNLHMIPEYSNF